MRSIVALVCAARANEHGASVDEDTLLVGKLLAALCLWPAPLPLLLLSAADDDDFRARPTPCSIVAPAHNLSLHLARAGRLKMLLGSARWLPGWLAGAH